MNKPATISIIMPTYNEAEIIVSVIDKWVTVFDRLKLDYTLHVYNDGSKDNTQEVLEQTRKRWPHVQIHNKTNSGHGPTILQGYREADTEWIFQTDSDDEMPPDCFEQLWEKRENYDFLIGRRENRVSPPTRQLVSALSRLVISLSYGRGVYDVNSPFRLMRRSFFEACFNSIPSETFAPNLAVTGYACLKKARIYEIPVPHTPRTSGTSSINKWKLLKVSIESLLQTIGYRLRIK